MLFLLYYSWLHSLASMATLTHYDSMEYLNSSCGGWKTVSVLGKLTKFHDTLIAAVFTLLDEAAALFTLLGAAVAAVHCLLCLVQACIHPVSFRALNFMLSDVPKLNFRLTSVSEARRTKKRQFGQMKQTSYTVCKQNKSHILLVCRTAEIGRIPEFGFCYGRPRMLIDIICLEQIQRIETQKFILRASSLGYKSRLHSLQRLPLMHWLEFPDIMCTVSNA